MRKIPIRKKLEMARNIALFKQYMLIEEYYRKNKITLDKKNELLEGSIRRSQVVRWVGFALTLASAIGGPFVFLAVSATYFMSMLIIVYGENLAFVNNTQPDSSRIWYVLRDKINKNRQARTEIMHNFDNNSVKSPKLLKDGKLYTAFESLGMLGDTILDRISFVYKKMIPVVLNRMISISGSSSEETFDSQMEDILLNCKKMSTDTDIIITRKLSSISQKNYNSSIDIKKNFTAFYKEFFTKSTSVPINRMVDKIDDFDKLHIKNPAKKTFVKIYHFLNKDSEKNVKIELNLIKDFQDKLNSNFNISDKKRRSILNVLSLLEQHKLSIMKGLELVSNSISVVAAVLTDAIFHISTDDIKEIWEDAMKKHKDTLRRRSSDFSISDEYGKTN